MSRRDRARKMATAHAHAARRDNRREPGAELLSVQRKRAVAARRAASRAARPLAAAA